MRAELAIESLEVGRADHPRALAIANLCGDPELRRRDLLGWRSTSNVDFVEQPREVLGRFID